MFIRPALASEFNALRAVELAASATLRAAGAVTGAPSAASVEELQGYLNQDLLYVACDAEGLIAGFCGGSVAGRFLHLGEVDVHPAWQQKGLGRRLLTALLDIGRARGLVGATLTTDRLAPFNMPFYATLGFQLLEAKATPPWLREILQLEVERGLDPLRRVGMILMFWGPCGAGGSSRG